MDKIVKISKWLRIFFQIIFVIFPIAFFITFMLGEFNSLSPEYYNFEFGYSTAAKYFISSGAKALYSVTPIIRVFLLLICTIPLSLHLFVIYSLIKLFRSYEKKNILYMTEGGNKVTVPSPPKWKGYKREVPHLLKWWYDASKLF